MPFGWGIVSTGKHPDIKIAPAMAAADGGELVGVYSRDQHQPAATGLDGLRVVEVTLAMIARTRRGVKIEHVEP